MVQNIDCSQIVKLLSIILMLQIWARCGQVALLQANGCFHCQSRPDLHRWRVGLISDWLLPYIDAFSLVEADLWQSLIGCYWFVAFSHWLLPYCSACSLVAADLRRSLIGCCWFVAVYHWLLLISGDLALVTSILWCVLLGWCWFVTLSHWFLLICGVLSLIAAVL